MGNQVVIRTDRKSLKYITTQRLVEGIQHKLLLKLLEFDYVIEYKKGKENVTTHALSRRDSHSLEEEEKCQAIVTIIPEWVEDVKNSYVGDPQYEKIVVDNQIQAGVDINYTLESGLVKYKRRIYVGIGNDSRKRIMDSFHSSSLGGHSGLRATCHRLKKLFYWPKLKKDVELLISECPVCQITKSEHVHIPGLLNPLVVPDMAWTHISMNFIKGLPKSKGKEVILVVVDRFTKYAHFLSLSHPYSVQQVVQIFMDNIFKLHGMTIAIVTDRDRIFTSHLFQEIFSLMRVSLRLSSAYHPQTDGQTERVNQCLESYLRSMTFQEPREWMNWLTLAEWWYNTSYHTSLKLTPFQALYGYPPPHVGELSIPCNVSDEARVTVEQKERMVEQLKENMHKAQERIKHFADKNRSERELVYLKMQPYRQSAFGIRGSLKLRSKFYGPFKVLEKIGDVAYRLQLPDQAMIHPVFHVSQLKRHLGSHAVPIPRLPLVGENGKIKTEPMAVLDRRVVPRRNEPVAQ